MWRSVCEREKEDAKQTPFFSASSSYPSQPRARAHTHTRTHTCAHTYTHAHMHTQYPIHTHTYTHTQLFLSVSSLSSSFPPPFSFSSVTHVQRTRRGCRAAQRTPQRRPSALSSFSVHTHAHTESIDPHTHTQWLSLSPPLLFLHTHTHTVTLSSSHTHSLFLSLFLCRAMVEGSGESAAAADRRADTVAVFDTLRKVSSLLFSISSLTHTHTHSLSLCVSLFIVCVCVYLIVSLSFFSRISLFRLFSSLSPPLFPLLALTLTLSPPPTAFPLHRTFRRWSALLQRRPMSWPTAPTPLPQTPSPQSSSPSSRSVLPLAIGVFCRSIVRIVFAYFWPWLALCFALLSLAWPCLALFLLTFGLG